MNRRDFFTRLSGVAAVPVVSKYFGAIKIPEPAIVVSAPKTEPFAGRPITTCANSMCVSMVIKGDMNRWRNWK